MPIYEYKITLNNGWTTCDIINTESREILMERIKLHYGNKLKSIKLKELNK